MKYYSAIKGASNDSHGNLDGFQRIYTEWKKPNPKCGIMCDFTYIIFDVISQKWREDYGSQGTGEKGL